MRTLIALSVLLSCMSVRAARMDYFVCRNWVERACVTNTAPQDERLFIGRNISPKIASIIGFHKGISLRQIIDQTPLKGGIVKVCVMRLDHTTTGPFTRFSYIKVGPSDFPNFALQSLDVIWLYDDDQTIQT